MTDEDVRRAVAAERERCLRIARKIEQEYRERSERYAITVRGIANRAGAAAARDIIKAISI